MPGEDLSANANRPAASGTGRDDAGAGSPKTTIKSGMAIVYGFLASLILTDYLKVASKALYVGPVYPFFALILLASFYLFYMIFDTLVWLVHYDQNPGPGDGHVPTYPRVEVVLWLLCRSVEFIILLWLYDFANIMEEVSKAKPDSDLVPQLARLCLDIGSVCLGWAVWFLIFLFTHISREPQFLPGEDCQEQRQKKRAEHKSMGRENIAQLALHVVFAAVFFVFWFWFRSDGRPPHSVAFFLAYAATVVSVLRVYVVQKVYYSTHFYLYRA